jgi:hypothetical protein
MACDPVLSTASTAVFRSRTQSGPCHLHLLTVPKWDANGNVFEGSGPEAVLVIRSWMTGVAEPPAGDAVDMVMSREFWRQSVEDMRGITLACKKNHG